MEGVRNSWDIKVLATRNVVLILFGHNHQSWQRKYCKADVKVLESDKVGDLSLVENVFPITLRTTITCNTCFCSSIKEDMSDILILPIQSDFFISKQKP